MATSNGHSGAGVDAQSLLAEIAREALVEKRRSRRWSIFFKLLIFLYVTGFLLYSVVGSRLPELMAETASQHTAVVDIQGVIAAGQSASTDPVLAALENAFEHPQTAGVLLRINSPGGSPVQSGQIYDAIRQLRDEYPAIPVHAVIEDVAASGGYYIAAAAENIYANRASIVGSIGVRMDSFGATEALQKLGVERRLLTAGEHKGMLDPFLPENPEVRQHMQGMLDTVHRQFIAAVRDGRGDRLAQQSDLFSGLIWSGEQALEVGLVDALLDERAVASDVIGVERRRDFTQQKDFLTRLADRVGASARLLIRSATGTLESWTLR